MRAIDAEMDTRIIDSVGSLVIVTNSVGEVIRFNSGGTRILGYSEAEVMGKVIWDLFPLPRVRARTRERFKRLMLGEHLEVGTVWLTRDGQERNIDFLCRAWSDAAGNPRYTIGTGIDVTQRVAAERALRESEQRYRTTFAEAAIGIALVEESGRYLAVNRAFCDLVGYEEKDLLGMDLFSITHPDDLEKNREMVRKAFSGEKSAYVLEKRYVLGNGREVLVQVSGSMVRGSGQTPMLIGLFQNISEQRRAQDELKLVNQQLRALNDTLEQRVAERTAQLRARTEELALSARSIGEQSRILRSVLDSMGDAVYVANAAGELVLLNREAERISGPIEPGSSLNERLRRPWFFQSDGVTPYPPEDLPLYRCARGETVTEEELLMRRAGRPELWTSCTARPLLDEAGGMHGAVLVARDITERKRQQEALRQSEQHYRELADSHMRLAREMEHRVRNNLAGLVGLTNAMRGRSTDVRSFADAIQSRLLAMLHVHELLAQSRWSAVSLVMLVERAMTALKHLSPCTEAAVQVEGPEIAISPRCVLPLTQILVEWFTNSCKYGAHSQPGGSVCVAWQLAPETTPQLVRLTWTERGGPPIAGTPTPSLGTELVKGFASLELGGRCDLCYPVEGADHVVEFPIDAAP